MVINMKINRMIHIVTVAVLSAILVCSTAIVCAFASDGTVTLTFNTTVEKGIPEGTNLSIGTNLNNWNPRDTKWYAEKIDANHFTLTVSVDSKYIDTEIEYKWTIQYPDSSGNGWEYTENAVGTGTFGNRKYIIKEADNVINDKSVFTLSSGETQSTLTCGTLETVEMTMPQFTDGRKRTIRIWLPDGYDPSDTKKRYSVLYMHDGQNLFDAVTSFIGEWEVDESVTKLMKQGYESTIVVGIDNGQTQRFNELSPPWERNSLGKQYITAPVGDKYADFIVETVKPYIDEHYNTKPQREYTGIGGSSMGGIISLYMGLKYADVFDYGIIFSPALHIYNDDTLDKFFDSFDFTAMKNLPRFYVFAGGATGGSEPGSAYDEACITKYVEIISDKLTTRGYPEESIGMLVDKKEYHIESTWAKFFPTALKWLLDSRKIPGDVNCDGVLNIDDATAIQKHIAEIEILPSEGINLADFNKDGIVGIDDVTSIQLQLAGLE